MTEEEFKSLEELVLRLRGNSNNIVVVRENDLVGLLSLSISDHVPKVKYGLTVNPDLTIEAFCNDSKINMEVLNLRTDVKLVKYTQLLSIFDTFRGILRSHEQ